MKTYLQKHDKIKYSNHWSTPKNIYDKFINELGYYDPCPLFSNIEVEKLLINCDMFINPPYSDINSWVDMAIKNYYLYAINIVLLVPSRTDVRWFHKLLDLGVDIEFIKGRLKFGNAKNSAPFPSLLIYLNGKEVIK